MKTEYTKLILLFTLFIICLLFTLLPVKLFHVARNTEDLFQRHRYSRLISLLSCLAAGVFFGTFLLDLFPDVDSKLHQAFRYTSVETYQYPLAEFITAFGFFIILSIEQIALASNESAEQSSSRRMQERYRSINDAEHNEIPTERTPIIRHPKGFGHGHSHSVGSGGEPIRRHSLCIPSDEFPPAEGAYDSDRDEVESIVDRSMHVDPHSHSTLRSIVLLLALSVHSVFEGLAIGLQETNAKILQVFVALMLHKCLVAFSLGINLVQSQLSLPSVIKSNFFFALCSPLGIGIGIAIQNFSSHTEASLLNGILQGIACGTFLYVVFFELLPHEFNRAQDRLIKLLFLIIGFSVVASLVYMNHVLDADGGETSKVIVKP